MDREPHTDPSCVWLSANGAHVPNDALPASGAVSLDGSEIAKLCASRIECVELQLPKKGVCSMGGVHIACERAGYIWSSKDPSPLAERCLELGGCEHMRLQNCPVVLGYLRPAATITVVKPDGGGVVELVLPLSEFEGKAVELLRLVREQCDLGDEALDLCDRATGSPLAGPWIEKPTALMVIPRGAEASLQHLDLGERVIAEESPPASPKLGQAAEASLPVSRSGSREEDAEEVRDEDKKKLDTVERDGPSELSVLPGGRIVSSDAEAESVRSSGCPTPERRLAQDAAGDAIHARAAESSSASPSPAAEDPGPQGGDR